MAWTKSGLFYATQLDQWDDTNLGLDLTSENWRVAFFGSTVTPNFSTDTAYGTGTWASGESSGAGYTTGGVPLANTTLAMVGSSMVWDADNVELDASTITAEGVLLYLPTVSNRAFAAVWFGASKETQDGTFLITWASGGIAALALP
ncbi:MAG: hypothetical protein IRY84_07810 [Thermobispora bispora]|nr:hypothetical protein [Thermobispora bispora]